MDVLKTKKPMSTDRTPFLAPSLTAFAFVACLGAVPAFAEGLSIGLGGLGEVSIGRDSLADVDVDVGGLDVEAGVLERETLARGCVGNCDGGGTSVGVSVGSGGVTASVGSSGTTGTTTGTPGSPRSPGTPGTVASGTPGTTSVPETQPKLRRQAMACAGTGNSAVYNGYPLVDRNGVMIGQVHDTRLSPDLKITGVRVQTNGKRCVGLEGGSYKVLADGRVWVNMDGARLR